MNHSINILFWLHKTKIDKSDGIPIYARITVNGKRTELATGKKIKKDKWNKEAGRAKGNAEEARTINKFLDNLNVKLTKIHDKLFDEGKFISSQLIKDIYMGKTVKQHSLIELFKFHNQQIKELIGKGYATDYFSITRPEDFRTFFRKIGGIQPFKKRIGTVLPTKVTALEDAFRLVVHKGGPIDPSL